MLRRIRIGFVLLALLLLAPLGFLVGRTLDTLDRERELQHADVANRVFDEAEGALADFLREEQARPASAYRRRPSGVAWMESRPPFVLAYFEIERDGEVRTSTPEPALEATLREALTTARVAAHARPGAEAPSGEAVGDVATEPSRRPAAPEPGAIAREGSVGDGRQQEEERALEQEKKSKRESRLAPGKALNVQSIDLITGRAKAGKADAGESEAETEDSGAYSSSRALETLGRIAKTTAREEVLITPSTVAEASPDDDADREWIGEDDLFALRTPLADQGRSDPARRAVPESETPPLRQAEAKGSGPGSTAADTRELATDAAASAAAPSAGLAADEIVSDDRVEALAEDPAAREPDGPNEEQGPDATGVAGATKDEPGASQVPIAERIAAAGPRTPAPATAARAPLALAPSRLSGERVDARRLLLYRTALDDTGSAVRQGMLVSVDDLGAWLTRRVLGESELRESLDLQLRAAAAALTERLPSDRYVYAYRFAEPFEMLSLQLGISPLDDGGNARNIAWLSALLVAASTLGLYAVYRTAAVAVHFAERRSNFAAAVSHELKTPLTSIRMYGEMLRDGMVADEAKRNDYYRTITRESERLTRLIDNVLEWSKLERHEREAALVTGDPSAAIHDVVEVVGPHAEAHGFDVVLRLAPELPPVRHDPDALQQILYNLIDNAIKYARGHEPQRVEVEAVPAEGDVVIRVRDHGPGVPAAKLPLVFEAFYRGEDELTRETKGTGIGLALARGLADSMHARLHARNHPDGGFEVELRLAGKPSRAHASTRS